MNIISNFPAAILFYIVCFKAFLVWFFVSCLFDEKLAVSPVECSTAWILLIMSLYSSIPCISCVFVITLRCLTRFVFIFYVVRYIL